MLTKAYLPLQPFSAPIRNYNTPLILFRLVADTHTDRYASVSNYEALLLVIWDYFISYIMYRELSTIYTKTAVH